MINTPGSFIEIVAFIIGLINQVIPILGSFALILFLWGGLRMVYRSGDAHGHNDDKKAMQWSVIALFVLFSIWGILRLMSEAFLPGAGASISEPNVCFGCLY